MNLVSKVALAAALFVASGEVAPAFAARDKAVDSAPTVSPALRTAIVAARSALANKDFASAEQHVATVEAAATTDLQRYFGQSLRLGLEDGRAQGQPEARRATLLIPLVSALIANPATPRAEIAQHYVELGNLQFATKKYADARQSFLSAREAGSTDPDLLPNIARARVASGDVAGGVADLEASVAADKAAGRKVPEDVYTYAIAHLYAAKANDQVARWTKLWLADYGTAINWRSAVYTLGLTGPSAGNYTKSQLDLYRLLHATKGLAGQKDYLNYAAAAAAAGVPEEAAAAMAEGRAVGAIPTGVAVPASKKGAAKAKGVAMTPEAREKRALTGSGADLAQAAGDAYLGSGTYAKAAAMYQLAAQRRIGDIDRNNLHLGIALALAGDRAGAATAFAGVTGEPHRAIAGLWTTYVEVAPAA